MTQRKKAVLLSLAAIVLALIAVIVLFDWNWVRDPAARYAGRLAARQISVGGMEGQFSLKPRIVLRDIHIGNVEWSDQTEMLSADEIALVIDLPQLLRGRLVIPELTLTKPRLVMERDKDGNSNWTFGARAAADTVTPDERTEVPLIGRLEITNGELLYRDPKAGLNIDGKISTAVGLGGEGRSQLRFQGNGSLQQQPFKAIITGGSLLILREGEEPYPVNIDISALDSHLLVKGTLDDPIQFEGLNLTVDIEGPDLSRLTKITGLPLPITPPYKLAGRLERDGDHWSIKGLEGDMGHSDLSGDILLDAGRERPYLEADLHSETLDYRDVGSLIGIDVKPEPEKEAMPAEDGARAPAETVVEGPPPRVLPIAPLSIAQVKSVDAKVHFTGKKVDAPNVPLDGVDLHLSLDNGVLKFSPLEVGVAGGITRAFITIDARQRVVVTDYDLRLINYRLERFLKSAGLEGKGQGRIDGRVRLRGTGPTVADSLGTANGDIRLAMSGGEVSNLGMELAGLDVAESLGFLIKGDERIPIRCVVADLGVKDGAVTPRTFVFDTTDTLLTAEGGMSFKDESLDLKVAAHPKDSSFAAMRTPITLTGYFSRPEIGVEKAPLIVRGAVAIALGVLLTPVASILAFIDPSLQQDSDCARLLQDSGISN